MRYSLHLSDEGNEKMAQVSHSRRHCPLRVNGNEPFSHFTNGGNESQPSKKRWSHNLMPNLALWHLVYGGPKCLLLL